MHDRPIKWIVNFALGLLLLGGWALCHGEQPPADAPYQPPGAIAFKFNEEIKLGMPLVESVEFTKQRCNMTLRNMTGKRSGVEVEVLVMNADGVTIWTGYEVWAIASMDEEEKYLSSMSMSLAMPTELKYSKYAEDFDATPVWFKVIDRENDTP